jgi:hypothetical protein
LELDSIEGRVIKVEREVRRLSRSRRKRGAIDRRRKTGKKYPAP